MKNITFLNAKHSIQIRRCLLSKIKFKGPQKPLFNPIFKILQEMFTL